MFRHLPMPFRVFGPRLYSSVQHSFIEPESTVNPRVRKKKFNDSFCQKIKEAGPSIDWEDFRSKYNPRINPARNLDRNFEARVMDCLIFSSEEHQEPHIGDLKKSFLNYVRAGDIAEPLPLVFELGLCALMGHVDAVTYGDEIAHRLLKVLDSRGTATRFPVFSHCITGLSKSSKKHCLLAVDMALNHRLTARSISGVVQNCLHLGLLDEAFDLNSKFEIGVDTNMWIESFLHHGVSDKLWVRFMKHCGEKNLSIPKPLNNHTLEIFRKLGYKVQDSKVDANGTCSCGSKLRQVDQEMCDKLRGEIFSGLLKGPDVFLNSSPVELKEFMVFIDRQFESGRYYDLVVDGLNAMMAVNPTVWTPGSRHSEKKFTSSMSRTKMSNTFKMVMNQALKHFNRVLVIGRIHMLRNPGIDSFLRSNQHVINFYALQDDTKDDAFILYAGVRSPHTFILSNDFFRDHFARLDDEQHHSSKNFSRWHQFRNILVNDVIEGTPPPPLYDTCVNLIEESNLIHVPFQQNRTVDWICCRKK